MINRFPDLSLKPRNDCVLVKLEKLARESVMASGIIMIAQKARPIDGAWATVVALPDDLKSFRRSCKTCERPYDPYHDELKVGDRVLLDSDLAGDQLDVGGEEHRLVRMAEIQAVVESGV